MADMGNWVKIVWTKTVKLFGVYFYFLSVKTIELRDIRTGKNETSVKCKLILPCLSERF